MILLEKILAPLQAALLALAIRRKFMLSSCGEIFLDINL